MDGTLFHSVRAPGIFRFNFDDAGKGDRRSEVLHMRMVLYFTKTGTKKKCEDVTSPDEAQHNCTSTQWAQHGTWAGS